MRRAGPSRLLFGVLVSCLPGWSAGGDASAGAGAAAPSRPAYQGSAYAPVPGRKRPPVAELTELGRAMFFEPTLSASGKISCASCHDPAHAYGPPNALPVQRAGRDGRTPGLRAVPSLRYLQTVPPFSEHHFDDDGDDSIDAGPTGGHTWDGRASSAHEQARLPLLSAMEMANGTADAVVAKLERSALAARFRQDFGDDVFTDRRYAFDAMAMALEVFQESSADFYPYSSRYDQYLRGKARLTPQESSGLRLFNDARKGNCASCHLSAPAPDGAFPLFTDFGHIAIGVPRNAAIPANADPRYHDLGLCGPLRSDFADRPEYCGRFRTPTLRNVALRRSYFHNGVFHTLDQVLRFYVERDTHPERYYPKDAAGRVRRFDDLPQAYKANLNTDPPFDRHPGDAPALSDAEIRDVIAFLRTLTDADLAPAQPLASPSLPAPSRGSAEKLSAKVK